MPAKRTYNVRVQKDFIVLAGVFFFLCLWAVKDAWYPSDKVLKKHPHSVKVSFETAGTVGKVHVGVGDSIGEGQLLAELRSTKMEVDFEAAKKKYTAAKNKYALTQEALGNAVNNGATDDEIAEIKDSVVRTKAAMDASLKRVGEIRVALDSTGLLTPTKGEIMEVLVSPHSHIEAGETAMVIDPKDHFYLFNKSLAIFSFIAFWVFLSLHLLAS
ncbi:MAG: hypothetical protein KAU94_05590 [Verrucomicrobia bacterium]|nr:hypothetical protein [Verrucomicrobiota bacterium]